MIRLGAKELRTTVPQKEDLLKIRKNPIYIVLDNVLDTYNVGGIFRLADAVAASKVILCGQTETPPSSRIKKASINTTEWVSWDYQKSAKKAIDDLRFKIYDLRVFAVEQNKRSISYDKTDYDFPIALVVGHESEGVSKEVLEIADQIIEIPMWGVNRSLNVIVSLGVVLFEVMNKCRRS